MYQYELYSWGVHDEYEYYKWYHLPLYYYTIILEEL